MKFHPFGCASLTTRLLFELCACVLYIRLSIQWVIWVFFHYRWIFQRFPARGKVLRDPKWEKDTRIHTDWPGSLRAFSLSVWGAGWYASRSVRFNQPYINADPWPSSFMYHPTLSLKSQLVFFFPFFWFHISLRNALPTPHDRPHHERPRAQNRRRLFLLGGYSINLRVDKSRKGLTTVRPVPFRFSLLTPFWTLTTV